MPLPQSTELCEETAASSSRPTAFLLLLFAQLPLDTQCPLSGMSPWPVAAKPPPPGALPMGSSHKDVPVLAAISLTIPWLFPQPEETETRRRGAAAGGRGEEATTPVAGGPGEGPAAAGGVPEETSRTAEKKAAGGSRAGG